MNTTEIQLKDIDDVLLFIDIVSSFPEDIDVIRGSLVIDAKSILGLFNMDLSQPIKVSILSFDKDVCEKFISAMREFAVDK